MRHTVSIVEDNQQMRETLAGIFAESAEFQCVGIYGSAEEALIGVPACPPDVVLMDIRLPGLSGIQCLTELRRRFSQLVVVMLTVFEDTDKLFMALQAGASGYLLKSAPSEELLPALHEVLRGGAPMSSSIARRVVQSFHRRPPQGEVEDLSPREREILDTLSKGFLIKEIADRLGISPETVKTHLKKIYDKLHVRSRTEAVVKFLGKPPRFESRL